MITYNHVNYIREAIEGVLMQECHFEVELILANDCSSDATHTIIEDILKNHPQASWIKYINHKENLGMMSNFIWALQQCKGKYIALCEGDDYWTDPLKLQKQVDFLEANPDYVVCYHDAGIIDESGSQVSNSILRECKKDYSKIELKKGAWLPTLTRCFRNENFVFPPEFYQVMAGDHFLTGILGLHGKAKYLDFNGANYREHSNGVWTSKNKFYRELAMLKDYIKICEYWHSKKDMEIYNFYKQSLKKTNENLIKIVIKKHNLLGFFKILKLNFLDNKSFYNFHNAHIIFKLSSIEFLKKMNY